METNKKTFRDNQRATITTEMVFLLFSLLLLLLLCYTFVQQPAHETMTEEERSATSLQEVLPKSGLVYSERYGKCSNSSFVLFFCDLPMKESIATTSHDTICFSLFWFSEVVWQKFCANPRFCLWKVQCWNNFRKLIVLKMTTKMLDFVNEEADYYIFFLSSLRCSHFRWKQEYMIHSKIWFIIPCNKEYKGK